MYLFFYAKKDEKDEKVTLQFHLFCLWELFYKQKLNLSSIFYKFNHNFQNKKTDSLECIKFIDTHIMSIIIQPIPNYLFT